MLHVAWDITYCVLWLNNKKIGNLISRHFVHFFVLRYARLKCRVLANLGVLQKWSFSVRSCFFFRLLIVKNVRENCILLILRIVVSMQCAFILVFAVDSGTCTEFHRW